jgi:hypothetical protein
MFGHSIQDDPSMQGSAFDRGKESIPSGVQQVPTERNPSQIQVYKQRQSSVAHAQRFRLRHKSVPLLKRIVPMNVGITHPAIMIAAFADAPRRAISARRDSIVLGLTTLRVRFLSRTDVEPRKPQNAAGFHPDHTVVSAPRRLYVCG